jgi:dTDP-glucose pyrophosphorylase
MTLNVEQLFMKPNLTIREAMVRLNENPEGIVLVIDDSNRLLDTITDGDLRRAILGGITLDAALSVLASRRASSVYPNPITVGEQVPLHEIHALMSEQLLRQIPIVDAEGRVVDLVVAGDINANPVELPVSALIMAGGRGTRLRPLTDDVPKPLLPVGGKPIMEHTIARLEAAGVRTVLVSTHYRAEAFREHFGNGADFGVNMDYVQEDEPLGTAGALRLVGPSTQPVLVINGDVLTQINYRAMLAFHQENDAAMTVGVSSYDLEIPYGVVELDGVRIKHVVEKPTIHQFINAGVYLLEPRAVELIPETGRFDMTDLIETLLKEGHNVVSFPISEYWLDIGQHGDYARAQKDADSEGAYGS